MSVSEEDFIVQSRESLDNRADALEPHLATRLQAARKRALAANQQPVSHAWLPAMASAAFALLMVVGIWFGNIQEQPQVSVAQLDYQSRPADMEMMLAADEFELFKELEFIQWLEKQDAV
jgi:hypothetical protein